MHCLELIKIWCFWYQLHSFQAVWQLQPCLFFVRTHQHLPMPMAVAIWLLYVNKLTYLLTYLCRNRKWCTVAIMNMILGGHKKSWKSHGKFLGKKCGNPGCKIIILLLQGRSTHVWSRHLSLNYWQQEPVWFQNSVHINLMCVYLEWVKVLGCGRRFPRREVPRALPSEEAESATLPSRVLEVLHSVWHVHRRRARGQ